MAATSAGRSNALPRRAPPDAVGERVVLTGMTATVTAITADGRPAEAAFRFDVPLEDASLRWLWWQDGEFRPFTPPAVGQTLEIPAAVLRWCDGRRERRCATLGQRSVSRL